MKKIIILLSISFFYLNSYSQITISQVRDSAIGTVVTVTGIVTNGSELGVIRYIQDSTGGIGIYPNTGSVAFTPNRGDEVTVTGTISEYAGLLEISDLTEVVVNSTGNNLPEPVVITPTEITETYEGQLVKIEEALFDNPGSTFAGNTNYSLSVNGEPFVIRINTNSNIVGEVIPAAVNLVAIVSQFSWNSATEGYQLLPRDTNDLEVLTILNITSLPVQTNITKTGFTLSWTTNDTALTGLAYGLTENLELDTITGTDYVTEHTVNLTGLEAGKIYYVKAFATQPDDTASTALKVYATESNSSGEIKVYFTQSVDHSVATTQEAVSAINTIEDTIISYIDLAVHTLDIVIYDVESERIVQAINDAYNRGVAIRYITDSVPDTETNPVLNNLNANIPLLKGNTSAIMHDKFIIIDRESVDSSWVITGSTNHTYANLGWDKNNMICIQDQSLANGFLLEFNEMWGANGMIPDAANAKFGSAKKDNTPHNFIIGGKPVELYFSPSDHTTSAIIDAVSTAQNDLEFAVMVFTENGLGDAVNAVHDAGANVRGIIDYVEYSGSEFNSLLSNGVDVLDYQNPDGTSWPDGPVFHHKYAIIDFNSPDSDPIVLTGSHNWSASAESSNDENTLIIHDSTIANLFHQEFSQRFKDLLTPVTFDDYDSTIINQEVKIDIIANDFVHFQIDSTNVEIVSQGNHGIAEIINDSLLYIPETGFSGYDTVSYKLCNAGFDGYCDTAICIIKVQLIEIFALDDSVTFTMNENSTFYPLLNDYGTADYDITASIVTNSEHGVTQISPDNEFVFYPENGFYGTDLLTYEICYANLPDICDTANVYLTVEPILPVANLDTVTTNMNHEVSVNVMVNDENAALFNLSLTIENDAAHGTAVVNDSIITYTPETSFWGLDTVTYRISNSSDEEVYAVGMMLINVLFVESVYDIHNNGMLKLYPNPNNGFFDIEFVTKSAEEVNIKMVDLKGKVVFTGIKETVAGKNHITLNNISVESGIYFLSIVTDEGTFHRKLLIKR